MGGRSSWRLRGDVAVSRWLPLPVSLSPFPPFSRIPAREDARPTTVGFPPSPRLVRRSLAAPFTTGLPLSPFLLFPFSVRLWPATRHSFQRSGQFPGGHASSPNRWRGWIRSFCLQIANDPTIAAGGVPGLPVGRQAL